MSDMESQVDELSISSEDLFADEDEDHNLYTLQENDDDSNIFPEDYIEHVEGPESDLEDDLSDGEEVDYQNDDDGMDNLRSRDPALNSPPLSGFLTAQSGSSNTIGTQQVWNWNLSPNHKANVIDFDDFFSGWNTMFTQDSEELEVFEYLFNSDIRDVCVTETNQYADQTGNCLTKRWANWNPVSEEELMRFLAIRMIMGINKKPEMKNYWAKDPLLNQPIIPQLMSQDRFFEIMKNLHFSNNQEIDEGDRIFKIRKVWDLSMSRFQETLTPHKNLSIDESLILHKGRLFFKQFIPSKRSRFGIKTFSIVDEETKFILNSMIYSGKSHELKYSTKEFGYGGAITLELIQPHLEKYHHLYVDNWFTSPKLAQELLQKNTYICGTLRRNRKNISAPKDKELKKGEVKVQTCNGIMTEFWKDKKVVSMISTNQDHEMKDVTNKTGENGKKPKSVLEYNSFARGIDLGDMMMSIGSTRRKSLKWYKKLFFHLVDMHTYNAFRIFKSFQPQMKYLVFRLNMIRQLISKYGTQKSSVEANHNHPLRLIGRHFPEYNHPTNSRDHGARNCYVCSHTKNKSLQKRKSTSIHCKTCKVPLCIIPCFEIYHTRTTF